MTNQRLRPPKNQKIPTPKYQTFGDHLQELRQRCLWCLFTLVFGTFVGYFLHSHLFNWLIKPLNQPIFYVSPTGGFDFVIKTSLFFGSLVALPVCVYHAVRFIGPAWPDRSPRLMIMALFSSVILMIAGMSFAYFISLPMALYFLSSFATADIQSLISTTEYFSFVTWYLFGFGFAFQLPLVLLLVNAVNKLSVRKLISFERWVIVGCFLTAAILTPTPDVFNQLSMALPLILLYQISVIGIWLKNR